MKKALKIAKWEFLEKIKKKSFIIYMIVFPMVVIGMGIIPSILTGNSNGVPMPIGILDETKKYQYDLMNALSRYSLPDGQPAYVVLLLNKPQDDSKEKKSIADQKVKDNRVEGYLIISENGNNLNFQFRSNGLMQPKDVQNLEEAINSVLVSKRLIARGIDPEFARNIFSDVKIDLVKIGEEEEGEPDLLEIFFSSYIFIMLLVLMIIFSGGMLVRSIVEEKSNRIMEILLSSCKADDLLTGKIIGLSWLGLFQLIVWFIVGGLLLGTNMIDFDLFKNVYLQITYFLLGYMLYTAIFVGIGSIVNTEQEAQQYTSYISILLVVPIIISIQVIQQPDSIIAKALSYFPLTTAPIMLLRTNVYSPPLWEIILTIFILIVGVYAIIMISSKIFRIGILSYGKRPSLKELREWMREN